MGFFFYLETNNFHQLEVVYRGNETIQIQVGENV